MWNVLFRLFIYCFKWTQLVANKDSFFPPIMGLCAFDLNTKGLVLGGKISVHCLKLHKDNSNIQGAELVPQSPNTTAFH